MHLQQTITHNVSHEQARYDVPKSGGTNITSETANHMLYYANGATLHATRQNCNYLCVGYVKVVFI